MTNSSKANKDLLDEISGLTQRIQELEASEADRKRAEQELTIIAEIGRMIGSSFKIEEVYEQFASEVQKLISFDRLTISLINQSDNTKTLIYVSGFEIPGVKLKEPNPLKGSIANYLLQSRSAMIINIIDFADLVEKYPEITFSSAVQMGVRSVMCVPLISQNEMIGVIIFWSKKLNAYFDKDLKLAEKIGRQIAGAIANAQLYASLAETEANLCDREEQLRRLSDNLPGGLVYQIDSGEDGQQRQFSYMSKGVEKMHGITAAEALNDATSVYGQVIMEDRHRVSEAEAQALSTLSPLEVEVGLRLPSGEIRWSHFSSAPRRLSNNHLVWDGIEVDITSRKQIEEELRERRKESDRMAEEAAILAEIGRKISSSLNIDEVFERLAAESKKLIQYVRLQVTLLEPQEEKFTVVYFSGDALPRRDVGDSFPMAGSMSEAVLNKRAGIIIQGADKDEIIRVCSYVGVVSIRHMDILSLMSVPLISNDNVIGVLHFRSNKPNAYSDQDLRLAEGIGRQIAGAIINAQLYSSIAKAEVTIRESEMRFHAIFDQAAVGVAEVGTGTGRFLLVNRRLCEIVGLTEKEMLATDAQSITYPEDVNIHEEELRLLHAGKIRNFSIEKRYMRKNGDVVWVSLTISPLWKPEDPPGNHLTIVQDISKQKEMEKAKYRSEIKYRTLFESAEDHIFILQPNGQGSPIILDANQVALNRFGRTREDLIGRPIQELIPLDRKRRDHLSGRLSNPGDRVLFETEHVDKNQTIFPMEVSAQMVQIDQDPPFILAIERDITERKRIEEELNHSKETAERLAQELTIINEIGRKISSTLNIEDVFEQLAAESRKLIHYDRLLVTQLYSKEAEFRVAYNSGFDFALRKVGDSIAIEGSTAGMVLNKRASVILQAADKNESYHLCLNNGITNIKDLELLSRMCVPLISNDTMIGVLHFGSRKPNAYTERDLHLAERIGREIAGAITNAQLYTNLQKTEKSLREGRELFLRLIDAAPDGVIQTDIDGKILFANEVALRMGGYTDISELRGRSMFNFIAPEDRERMAENLRFLPRQEPVPQICRVIGDGGRSGTVEISTNVLCDENGSPYGNVLLFRDVTERNRMEEELRTSEANYRFLTENMNDMIWTVDLDLNTTYVNKSVERLLGYSPEERIGKHFSEKCTPESYEHIRRIMADQLEIEKSGSGLPNRTISMEVEYCHKNGSTVWMENLVNGVRDKNGLLIGFHGVSRNIMERKKLEQELRKILDNLESRIQERTIELEEVNTALRVLLKKGEQDLKKQGHDIKDNVDRLVMPFLQKLKTSSSIDKQEMYANIIEANLTNITSPFTNQLSDSYKTLTPKEIQIAAMIKDGKSSKEVAEIMGVSIGTVVTHRNNIRKKLKLPSREINLRSHLLSLS